MDFPKSVPNIGLVGGRFVDENTGTGQPGSLIPSVWGNAVTLEILSVLAAAGVVADEQKTNQLADAISKLVVSGAAWSKLTGKPTIAFTGAATGNGTLVGSGAISIALSLADAGVIPGSYPKVVINAKGLVIGSEVLLASDIPGLPYSKITSGKPTTLLEAGITDKINGVGIAGAVKNLTGSAPGNSWVASFGADEIVLEDANGNYLTRRGVAVQVSVGVAGLGGIDTGASTANTWYSVWVISNGSAVFGLLSLSTYNPVLPSGYTYMARVGWIRTDATANKYPLNFVQSGRRVQYRIAAGTNVTQFNKLINGSTSNALTAVSVSASLPPTAGVAKILFGNSVGAVNIVYVATNATASIMDNAAAGGVTYTNNGTALVMSAEVVLESSNLYFSSGATQSFLSVIGWEDNL